jgi:hypothetical protein
MEQQQELMLMPTPQQLQQLGKKELLELAKEKAATLLDAGMLDELEVYIRAKKLIDFSTAFASAAHSKAYEAACKEQSKGHFTKFGATITHTTTGASYVYDNCQDPVLERLQAELNTIQERVKSRQKYLQSLQATGELFIDPETGEATTLYPPVKKGREDITIKY